MSIEGKGYCVTLKFQVKLPSSQLLGDDGYDQETNAN